MSCEHCPENEYDWDQYEVIEMYLDNTAMRIACKHCEREGVVYISLTDLVWEVTA